MLAVRPLLSGVALRNVAALSRAYHSNHRQPTVNDLPVPQGDFFEEHARKNRGYNRILILGVVAFALSFTIAKNSGQIHFNYAPPATTE